MKRFFQILPVPALGWVAIAFADVGSSRDIPRGRAVPARVIAVPNDVSPEMQDAMRRAATAASQPVVAPKTDADWRAAVAEAMAPEKRRAIQERNAALERDFPVSVVSGQMAGVPVYTITPPAIPPRNRHRAFVCLHGGGYTGHAGEEGINEGILLAHYAQMKVVSVDYRMPPDHPFPAAVDDAVAVWREVARTVNPASIGLGGCSAGGGLTLAVVMKLKTMNLPLPGAVYAGTPWADLTEGGDSIVTNDYIDNVAPGTGESLRAAGRLYAGTHDIRDPLISPVFGDFSHFPPTILISGTRDLLLSDTVRVHRKLRAAGVEADLHVFEAMSHGGYLTLPYAPESGEAHREIAEFLDRHLGR